MGAILKHVYPSNHLDSSRAFNQSKIHFIGRGRYVQKRRPERCYAFTERYIGKSDPYIVMVSTPNAPNGLFEKIEKEPDGTCIYKRLFLDYTYGLNHIYKREEIEKAKKSPRFDASHNLKYLGLIGNTFHPSRHRQSDSTRQYLRH